MNRLTEFGIVMFILGLNMIIIPNMFNDNYKFYLNSSDGVKTGIVFFIIGSFIIAIKIYKWLKEPD